MRAKRGARPPNPSFRGSGTGQEGTEEGTSLSSSIRTFRYGQASALRAEGVLLRNVRRRKREVGAVRRRFSECLAGEAGVCAARRRNVALPGGGVRGNGRHRRPSEKRRCGSVFQGCFLRSRRRADVRAVQEKGVPRLPPAFRLSRDRGTPRCPVGRAGRLSGGTGPVTGRQREGPLGGLHGGVMPPGTAGVCAAL